MTFKAGDKGKTRGGDEYEVVAVLDKPINATSIIAAVRSRGTAILNHYTETGLGIACDATWDLLPPKKKTDGRLVVFDTGAVQFYHDGEPIGGTRNVKATIPISLEYEEGEGL